MGTVIGWSLTDTGRIYNSIQDEMMPVVPFATCLESKRDVYKHVLTDNTFCAGHQNG